MARTRQQAWNEEEGRRRVKHENLRLVRAKRRNAGPPPVITIDSDGEREEVDSSREVPQPPATVHVRARPTTLTLKAGERPDAPVRLNGELPDGVRVKRDSDDDAPTAKRKRKMKLVASIDDSFQRVKEERCELEQVAQQQGTTAADFAADGRDYAESLAEQPTEIQSNPPPGNANEEQEDVASEASSGDSNLRSAQMQADNSVLVETARCEDTELPKKPPRISHGHAKANSCKRCLECGIHLHGRNPTDHQNAHKKDPMKQFRCAVCGIYAQKSSGRMTHEKNQHAFIRHRADAKIEAVVRIRKSQLAQLFNVGTKLVELQCTAEFSSDPQDVEYPNEEDLQAIVDADPQGVNCPNAKKNVVQKPER
ncbi:hypothetical protein M3Y99_01552000 [Aphelenchoides fujianensis]|nr:hypothetical protein M3Y99_01552000 [Aphelenchoides fujianensis]